MSHDEFQSERDARRFFNKHLLQMHGLSTTAVGSRLSLEQMERLHNIFHLDNWMHPPHSHDSADVTEIDKTFDEDYVANMIAIVLEETE